MPTVLAIFGWCVAIYPNDHRPVHVHVIGNGCEAVFNLHCPDGAPELRKNGNESMDISDAVFDAANRRAIAKKAAFPAATAVRYDRRVARVVISLASGLELAFPPKLAQGLEHARPADLVDAEITPSGLGIHFPRLDADLYIPALLEGFLGSKRWIAAEIGKLGGKASTDAKVAAARRNGKLGGRPKKQKGLIEA